VEAVDRAVSIATAAANEGLGVQAAAIKGFLLAETGRMAPGLALVEEALERANQLGHVLGAYFATWILGGMNYYRGDYAASIAAYQRELDSGRLDQTPEQQGLLLTYMANDYLGIGDLEPARRLLEESGAQGLEFVRLKFELVDGDWEAAVSGFAAAWPEWKGRGLNVFGFGPGYLTWLAVAQHTVGDLDGEALTLEEGLEISRTGASAVGKSQMNWLAARLLIDRGDTEQASLLLDELRDLIDLEAWGGLIGRLDQIEAEIAIQKGDVGRARALFDGAIAAYQTYPDPLFEAEFKLRWGRALVAGGEPGEASGLFDAAGEIYRRHGFAQRWIDRVEQARPA
jgi:tetratricopeptide (TPR) repeat protein